MFLVVPRIMAEKRRCRHGSSVTIVEKNHVVTTCPKRRDEVCIKAAVTARRAAAQQRGGQRGYRKSSGGGGRGSKGGTRGGSYRRTTFGTGKWSPPKTGEVARKIDKTVYCACQTCGWTSGSGAHSTGKHDEWKENPGGFSLHEFHPYMQELAKSGKKQSPGGSQTTNAGADKKSESGGSVGLAALATQALALEKETEDAETSAFAGQFAALLLAMSKSSLKE